MGHERMGLSGMAPDHGQVSCRVCSAEDGSDGRKVMNLLGVEGKEV